MLVEFSVFQIVKTLFKKWYILLAVGVICAVIVKPFSNAQYNSSLQQYNEKTDFQTIYNELIEKNLKVDDVVNSTDIPEEAKPSKFSSAKYFFSIDTSQLPEYIDINKDKYQFFDDLLHNVNMLSKDITAPIYNKMPELHDNISYAGFNNYYFYEYKGTNIFAIEFMEIPKPAVKLISKELANYFQEELQTNLNIAVSIKNISTTLDMGKILIEPEVLSEFSEDELLALTTQKLEFNKTILKEPSLQNVTVKNLGVAFLVGILLASFIVLLIDYLLLCYRFEKKNKASYE